jgi:hypothetical protein
MSFNRRNLPELPDEPRRHRGKFVLYWLKRRGRNEWRLAVPRDMTLH